MTGKPSSTASVFCCLDDVWQLTARPFAEARTSAFSAHTVQDLERQVVALEVINRALQLEASLVVSSLRSDLAKAERRLQDSFTISHALVTQSARPGDTGEAFRGIFSARLLALARSHALLGADYPEGAPLAEVVNRCLQVCDDTAGRTTVLGPDVHLPERTVLTLGLMFHELATNAVNHGALSTPQGRVEVSWQLEDREAGEAPSVAIVWREHGGPPVQAPTRRGFDSRLLEQGLAHEASGTTELDFASQGFNCRIRLPLPAASRRPPAAPA